LQTSLSKAAEVFHFNEERRREKTRMKVRYLVRSSIFLLLFPCLSLAGSNPKTAVAVRTPVPPSIDGVLDEPEWKLAKPITDFVQFLPNEGSEPTEKTEIRILYDDRALYFACTMLDSDPSKIVARLARRDDDVESDYIELLLDSYNDNQTDFEFQINASGTRVDLLRYDDGRQEDYSWDPVWEVKTRITEAGWVAEVRIPFKMLRYSDRGGTEWGLEIIRRVSRKKEQMHWALIRASDNGWASKFGRLAGFDHLPSSAGVEILPYTAGSGKFMPASPANPQGREFSANAGFDLKYHPSALFTVDATFNPDFGQVEADPAVLNLTTFQTFYPEKRPFFIEGTQIFHFSTFGDNAGPGLFYSRRIGRSINVAPPPGGYVEDQPNFATILGAAKISGKTQGGLSLGVLEAMTRQERATLVDVLGNKSNQVVEPLSNFSLVRLKQDVFENSNVGMILTNVSRDGVVPAYTGGIDWNLRFLQSIYRIDGFLALTHTTTADPIVQTGGGYNTGPAGKITVNKEGGEHWRWSLGLDFTSKGFNDNDIGFFRRPNDHGSVNTLQYREDAPSGFYQRWNVSAFVHYRSNFDNAELNNSIQLSGDLLLRSYWELQGQASVDRGKYDDRETRGNGLYRKPMTRNYALSLTSDPRLAVVGGLQLTASNDTRGSNTWSMLTSAEVKPSSNITLQFSLTHAETYRFFAWVANRTTLDDPSLPPNVTSSIFAQRTVSQWDLTTRGSFVFTQNLTLQYYLQLFFAKGKFENTQRMISNDTFTPYAFSPLTSDNPPDFSNLSLNSNVVLRWEYLPGSTLFLVWSQARRGDVGGYQTPFGEDVSNTFSLPADNVLMLKISYWLSM
jgi:hypothetical protein